MILVEVVIPSLGNNYDFELEENAAVDLLIKEIVTVICQKERCHCLDNGKDLSLYSCDLEHRLLPTETLHTSGIQNGYRLVLT